MNDHDEIPVRLPSGTKAIVRLPRPFTYEDGVHLMNFLSEYIEDPNLGMTKHFPSSLAKQVTNAQAEYDSWSPEKRASVRLEGSKL